MKIIYCLIVGVAILCASGCKDKCKDPTDPDCANYAPCHNFEPANAAFKMLDIPVPTYSWSCDGQAPRNLEFEVDTIFGIDTEITFRALHQADKYEWRVGSDARVWTTKEFALTFGPEAIGQVQVQHISLKATVPGLLVHTPSSLSASNIMAFAAGSSNTSCMLRIPAHGTPAACSV